MLDRRAKLLDEVADYILSNGLADLSLRPLATAIDTSPRMLLYFFGSKERLIAEALAGIRAREQIDFKRAVSKPRPADRLESLLRDWRLSASPRKEKYSRLFFEVYGLALQNPRSSRGFWREPSVIGCRCSSKHSPPLVFPLHTLNSCYSSAGCSARPSFGSARYRRTKAYRGSFSGNAPIVLLGCAITPGAEPSGSFQLWFSQASFLIARRRDEAYTIN